jgi:prepilin-type N-terminal cleavage/methylation domain-containing protein
MIRTPRRRRRRAVTAGFSLVELLTVIGIIALLLALLMPALSEARRNAQAVQCASNMRQLTTAMVSYATEFKRQVPAQYRGVQDVLVQQGSDRPARPRADRVGG